MTAMRPERLPTRMAASPDVPRVDVSALDADLRVALAELLLTMADDEFVIGFWDSEWTGIAPMLEEDVAFSSLAQDELGHARVYLQLRSALTGEDPDAVAFGREPADYRHAALLDHPRTDWAFSVARRWIYDTADAVRLAALRRASFRPLADVVAKIRREETYHLMHMDAWLRRLAEGGPEPRSRLEAAFAALSDDALSVFSPLAGETLLVEAAVLDAPMATLADRWVDQARAVLATVGLEVRAAPPRADGRSAHGDAFTGLWTEFTSVRRSDPEATW